MQVHSSVSQILFLDLDASLSPGAVGLFLRAVGPSPVPLGLSPRAGGLSSPAVSLSRRATLAPVLRDCQIIKLRYIRNKDKAFICQRRASTLEKAIVYRPRTARKHSVSIISLSPIVVRPSAMQPMPISLSRNRLFL